MSVYIEGMDLPTSCATCKLFGGYGCPLIGTVTYALTRGERHKDCPLIPVQPHGDLIERDALTISTAVPLDGKPYQYVHIDSIKGAPTIIPASGKKVC